MKIGMDIILIAFFILNLIYIPLELSFSLTSERYMVLYLTTGPLTILVFLMEIFIHLNTAIYLNGLIINDRNEITKHYLTTLLW